MKNTLVQVASSDKVPYVVTLFVAALGFALSHTLSKYDKLPIVEYWWTEGSALGDVDAVASAAASGAVVYQATLPNSRESGFVLTIQNISATSVIRCAKFNVLKLPHPLGPEPKVSNWITSTPVDSAVRRSSSGEIGRQSVVVYDMQPDSQLDIRMNATHVRGLALVATGCGDSELGQGKQETDVPVLKARSLETAFLKYAMPMFWLGLVAWIAFLAVILHSKLKSRSFQDDDGTG